MPQTAPSLEIIEHAPIPTWFRVGGAADRYATPRSMDALRHALDMDPALRVLGDGANLLVDDDGVAELVVSLRSPAFQETRIDARTGSVIAGAGADFQKLIHETVRAGLGGLEGLVGIPASVGGACIMNAGGAFGQFADAVVRVHSLDRGGRAVVRERAQIPFGYRHSGLTDLIITGVELRLTPGDPEALRTRLKECMAYKKNSQPLAADSAGCCFKNPTLLAALALPGRDAIPAGSRASAGLLIDKAGCKGVRLGGAEVSQVHGNFLFAHPGARARDVIDLMDEVARRVREAFGVTLEREVVVWERRLSTEAQRRREEKTEG